MASWWGRRPYDIDRSHKQQGTSMHQCVFVPCCVAMPILKGAGISIWSCVSHGPHQHDVRCTSLDPKSYFLKCGFQFCLGSAPLLSLLKTIETKHVEGIFEYDHNWLWQSSHLCNLQRIKACIRVVNNDKYMLHENNCNCSGGCEHFFWTITPWPDMQCKWVSLEHIKLGRTKALSVQ